MRLGITAKITVKEDEATEPGAVDELLDLLDLVAVTKCLYDPSSQC